MWRDINKTFLVSLCYKLTLCYAKNFPIVKKSGYLGVKMETTHEKAKYSEHMVSAVELPEDAVGDHVSSEYRNSKAAIWAKNIVTAKWYERLNIMVTYVAIFCEPLAYLYRIYIGVADPNVMRLTLMSLLLASSIIFLIDVILWTIATGPKYLWTAQGIINILAIGGTMVDVFSHHLGVVNPRVLRVLRTIRVVSKVSLAQRVKSGMSVLGSKLNNEIGRADLWFSLGLMLIFGIIIGGFNFGVYSTAASAYKELGFYLAIILVIMWKNYMNRKVIETGLDKKIKEQNTLVLSQMSNIPGLSNASAVIEEERAKSLKKGIEVDELGVMLLAIRSIINTLRRFISRRTFSEAKGDVVLPPDQPVSIIFSDVAGFTKMVESMSDEVLPVLVNYFEEVVGLIWEHGGDIDKFIGDAVFAFFHDPKKYSNATNFAFDAVCHLIHLFNDKFTNDKEWEKLFSKKEEWLVFKEMHTRYGLHYGCVTAGPIGSQLRADSTLLGDTVNTAARLESLCKKYALYMLMSGEFVEALSKERSQQSHRIDVVAVAGKEKTPMTIYTVDFEDKPKDFWAAYDKALQLKLDGRWQEAYNAFQSIQKQLIKAGEPENPTVAIMIKRIEDINQNWQEAVAVLSESCPEVFTPESAAKVEHYFENQEFKAPPNWKGFWVHTK